VLKNHILVGNIECNILLCGDSALETGEPTSASNTVILGFGNLDCAGEKKKKKKKRQINTSL
jgi:hypothetical protein